MNPILYAEDEPDDVFFIQKAFESAQVPNPLVVMSDGLQAIQYLSGEGSYSERAEHPLPCLVLLDINMPGKSGLEVLQWLRAQPGFCGLPALMLTSSTQEADIQRAYTNGANGFLLKPGRPDEQLTMVKAIRDFWLKHNRAVREIQRPENPDQ